MSERALAPGPALPNAEVPRPVAWVARRRPATSDHLPPDRGTRRPKPCPATLRGSDCRSRWSVREGRRDAPYRPSYLTPKSDAIFRTCKSLPASPHHTPHPYRGGGAECGRPYLRTFPHQPCKVRKSCRGAHFNELANLASVVLTLDHDQRTVGYPSLEERLDLRLV